MNAKSQPNSDYVTALADCMSEPRMAIVLVVAEELGQRSMTKNGKKSGHN